jgi:LacI family transcriptional regulator
MQQKNVYMEGMRLKYTIRDVAQRAGVSIATVSRVLNNKDRVNDDTRKNILKVIKEMNYTVNAQARRLRDPRTNVIGAIAPDISVSFYSEIIKGIENKADDLGYRLIVCDEQNKIEKERDYVKILHDGSVDGLIFVMSQLPAAEIAKTYNKNLPKVVFGINMEQYNIPSITVDNKSGAYNAVKHLYSHGFTKIAYIGGIEAFNDYDHRARLAGYKKALQECRLDFEETYIESGQYSEEGGSSSFMRLMQLAEPPDAIFCANDEMALGVLKTAKKMGIKIPQQIGLIGFDDIRICQYTSPALTSVRQPSYNIGILLCEKLIQIIETEENKTRHNNLVLKPELIIRESCGC